MVEMGGLEPPTPYMRIPRMPTVFLGPTRFLDFFAQHT